MIEIGNLPTLCHCEERSDVAIPRYNATNLQHASGGYLSCSGKKDTKEPAWGGADREGYRGIVRLVLCYPAFEPPSPRPLPAPVVPWLQIGSSKMRSNKPITTVIARRALARRGALSAQREEVPFGCNLPKNYKKHSKEEPI